MNTHDRRPFRIEQQPVMLAELRLRELHQMAAARRLAGSGAADHERARHRPPSPRTWLRLVAATLGLRGKPAPTGVA